MKITMNAFINVVEEVREEMGVSWFYRPSQILALETLVRQQHYCFVQPTGSDKSEVLLAMPLLMDKVGFKLNSKHFQ